MIHPVARAHAHVRSRPPNLLRRPPPRTQGTRALAKLAMLVYWNAGQPGFWDPDYDGAGLDLATPLGFEPLIASDPLALRREALDLLVPAEPALWLDPDPGLGPITPTFATPLEAEEARVGLRKSPPGVSRVAVLRLRDPDWIVACFRGTTPSPLRGLLREGQVNSMAGQETWAEAPEAMADARVHRGYAAAYRSVLAEVENAVAAWARESAAGETKSASKSTPRVVVVGHSLGGALAALCAARLAHEPDVLTLADRDAPAAESAAAAVECVTFGQPRVGDSAFRRGVDDASRLNYTRVVRGGDLFARVPTSGFWLPSGNGDQYSVEYAHAGSLVWTDADSAVAAKKGASAPAGFNSDLRMINPAGVAMDHAGYAYFFEDDALRRAWPSAEALR